MAKAQYFFDFSKKVITTGQLTIITNEQAVMESVYNILMTQPGERIMEPEFGCDLNIYLFEPLDVVNTALIEDSIKNSLLTFEPRVRNVDVQVDAEYDLNTYIIALSFSIDTSTETQTLHTTLNKIR